MSGEERKITTKEQFKDEKNIGREKVRQFAVEVLKGLHPIALHQFGSSGKGNSDEFSDLDLFVTLNDIDFDQVVISRGETYAKVAPVLLRLYERKSNSAGWYHDLIIYDTDNGCFQVDYYLTPRSKVVLPPNAFLIKGEENLPTGTWTVDVGEDTAEHDTYEAILAMSYIGIKGIVRGWNESFFNFLRGLYSSYKRNEDPELPELVDVDDFKLINSILDNLQAKGMRDNKKQIKKLKNILTMLRSSISNVVWIVTEI